MEHNETWVDDPKEMLDEMDVISRQKATKKLVGSTLPNAGETFSEISRVGLSYLDGDDSMCVYL